MIRKKTVQEVLPVKWRSPEKEDNISSYGFTSMCPGVITDAYVLAYDVQTVICDSLNESYSERIMIALQPLNTGDITNKIKKNKKRLKISVNAPECTDQPIQPVLKPKAQVTKKKIHYH